MSKSPNYLLAHCRQNCSLAAMNWAEFYQDLEKGLQELDFSAILKERFQTYLFHHIPKIALAGCPNGCSQPQIMDIGVTGFITPQLSGNSCSGCQTCISACSERAITWREDGIVIDPLHCVSCGVCIRSCPTEKIIPKESGWLLSLGGRLGRHPQFAKIIGKVRTGEEAQNWILGILRDYCSEGLNEERLTHYLERTKFNA